VSEDRYGQVRNTGEFDLDRMLARLGELDREIVGAHDYLRLLGAAFADARAGYSNRRPRYFVVKLMLSGVEWADPSPLDDARVLWLSRRLSDSYRSQRDKFFALKSDRTIGADRRAYHFFRDQCFALFYLAKQAVDVQRALAASPSTRVVDLRRLRSEPECVMRDVAGFLGIPFDACLLLPTFLGATYGGHFQDRTLNVGRIVDADSAHPEPAPFERHFLDRLDAAAHGGKLAPLGSFAASCRAIRDSLRDLPRRSMFTALAGLHMMNVDRRMRRIWNRDLSGAPYDPIYVYRPPRGIKTRLMRKFAKA